MSFTHIHLMLNHGPVFGFLLALLVFLHGLFYKQKDVQRVALWMFFAAALVAVPVYLTGDSAASDIRNLPSFSKTYVDDHETAALVSLCAVSVVGLIALWGLFLFYKKRELSKVLTTIILVLAVITFGSFVYTGNLGGKINHAELRPGFVAPPHQEDND